MSDAAALFARLQLRPDAVEQDVRRAYARELKKIDQATQAEAFQELRTTYEQLMWWLRSQQQATQEQAASAAPAPEPETANAPVEGGAFRDTEPMNLPAQEEPAAVAQENQPPPGVTAGHAVVDLVVKRLTAAPFKNRDEAKAFLVRCLEDQRLASVDARQYFEWGIASILASGWHAGHELVFAPAIDLFHWSEDRSRLLWLGRPGEIVDQAITELAVFDTQPSEHRALQKTVIRALRATERPTVSELMQRLPVAVYLAETFPAWMHVISNPRQLAAWHEWNAEIPGWRRKLARRPRLVNVRSTAAAPRRAERSSSWGWGVAAFVLIAVMRVATQESTPPPPITVPPKLALAPPAPAPQPFAPAPRVLTPQEEKMQAWKESVYRQSLADAARPSMDASEARAEAAKLAKGKASPERCQSVATLLRDQAQAHARGDFGPAMDTLVVDCGGRQPGTIDGPSVQVSVKRFMNRVHLNPADLTSK